MKKNLILILILLVILIANVKGEEGISMQSSVKNEMNVLIPNQYIFPHNYPPPGMYPIPDTEPYFGAQKETYNIATGLLLQILRIKDTWAPEEAIRIRKRKVKSNSKGLIDIIRKIQTKRMTHKRLTTIRIDKRKILSPEERSKRIKVVTSSRQLEGIKYELIGPIITYAKGTETTIDCFAQAVIDTVRLGGNVLFLLKAGSDFRVRSSTLGLGLAYTHSYIRGNHGGSGGGGTGWARNFTEPQSKPWLHGIALRVSKTEIQNIKPDLKLHPENAKTQKEIPIEQKGVQSYEK